MKQEFNRFLKVRIEISGENMPFGLLFNEPVVNAALIQHREDYFQ